MGVQGEARSYAKQLNFRVTIEGVDEGYWATCSPIVDSSAIIEQRTGGKKPVADKSDGPQSYENVTLTRGHDPRDTKMRKWRREIRQKGATPETKRGVSIEQLDDEGEELGDGDDLLRAWPVRYQKGGWDGASEENVPEEVELAFEDIDGDED